MSSFLGVKAEPWGSLLSFLPSFPPSSPPFLPRCSLQSFASALGNKRHSRATPANNKQASAARVSDVDLSLNQTASLHLQHLRLVRTSLGILRFGKINANNNNSHKASEGEEVKVPSVLTC